MFFYSKSEFQILFIMWIEAFFFFFIDSIRMKFLYLLGILTPIKKEIWKLESYIDKTHKKAKLFKWPQQILLSKSFFYEN